jgi:hypothetical protein
MPTDPGRRPNARLAAIATIAAGALAGAGCQLVGLASTAVSFSTDPPGARVVVDRKDSGFVTPCRLSMPSGSRHRIDLEMPGYEPVTVRVEKGIGTDIVLWRDMHVRPGVWNFPLWLNLQDAFEPYHVHWAHSPSHVFVRLERSTIE